MIIAFLISLVAATVVGTSHDADSFTQGQKMALYLIITGSAAGMIMIASTWMYL